jgi:hypothetical protein
MNLALTRAQTPSAVLEAVRNTDMNANTSSFALRMLGRFFEKEESGYDYSADPEYFKLVESIDFDELTP